MSMEKTAEFLADCLSHMPDQPEQLQCDIDTVIAVLTRIAEGGEWPEGEARAATMAAAQAADWVSRAADRDAAYWAEIDEARAAIYWAAANRASYWAAAAHPDPDAERARQAKVREKLGLNTEGA